MGRAPSRPAAGLGAELVAEVAGEAAGEVERQLGRLETQTGELALEVVEDRLVQRALRLARAAHEQAPLADVVGDRLRQRSRRVAHEGETRARRLVEAAVEPERLGRGEKQSGKRILGLTEPVEAPSPETEAGIAPEWSRSPRSRPARDRDPGRALARQLEEVGYQQLAVLAQDRLGMELNAPLRQRLVPERHRHVLLRPGARRERRGDVLDGERVVANGPEALRDTGEERGAVVADAARAAVHDRRRRRHPRAPGKPDRLVSQADAQDRPLRAANEFRHHTEIARMLRRPRPRRDHDRPRS